MITILGIDISWTLYEIVGQPDESYIMTHNTIPFHRAASVSLIYVMYPNPSCSWLRAYEILRASCVE